MSTDVNYADPDRFFRFGTPGSQEWWYFDALSDDGEYALVVVWYAGLPFDPDYGLAAIRHLKEPDRHPAPNPLDHSAIGFSLYHKGKTVAYALNRYTADRFAHTAEPFSIAVGRSVVHRDASGYRIHIETPAQDGRRMIRADLDFNPAADTVPVERNLGGDGGPHHWILAAADCRVEGTVTLEGPKGVSIAFRGRGYHDHNAGAEELSTAWTRWRWGRVHSGSKTGVYYEAEPRNGPKQTLWIVLDNGRPIEVRDDVTLRLEEIKRHPLGISYADRIAVDGVDPPVSLKHRHLVDYGPFYLRRISDFSFDGRIVPGISELLESRNLHSPWFNWMIPFRLKRPSR